MATKKPRSDAQTVPAMKPKKPELVTVSSDLRKVNSWFEEQSKEVIATAVLEQRRKLRAGRPKLSNSRLEIVVTIIERLQRLLNPLEDRQKRLVGRLKAHYGHTGETEFASSLGTTLVSTSASLAVDPDELRRLVGVDRWMQLMELVLKPEVLLLAAESDEFLRAAILRATRVTNFKVTVTPGNSRRPKSGKPEGE